MMDRLLQKHRWIHKELSQRIGLPFTGSEITKIGKGDVDMPLSAAIQLEELYEKEFGESAVVPGREVREDTLGQRLESYLPARMIQDLVAAGWSPTEIASQCGGSESTLRQLKCDHHRFSTRISMAAALGQLHEKFFGDRRGQTPPHPAEHLRALVDDDPTSEYRKLAAEIIAAKDREVAEWRARAAAAETQVRGSVVREMTTRIPKGPDEVTEQEILPDDFYAGDRKKKNAPPVFVVSGDDLCVASVDGGLTPLDLRRVAFFLNHARMDREARKEWEEHVRRLWTGSAAA